jgi:hypothetical protein
MDTHNSLALVAAAFSFLACQKPTPPAPEHPLASSAPAPPGLSAPEVASTAPTTALEFLGPRGAAILSTPDKVEVYRVTSEGGGEPVFADLKSDARVAGFDVREKGNDRGQAFAVRLGKVLLDDHSYRFGGHKRCHEGDKPRVATAGFDGVRPLLVRLAKEAFPKDAEVQALPLTKVHP